MRQQLFETYSHFYADNDGAGFAAWWEGLTPEERREVVGALAVNLARRRSLAEAQAGEEVAQKKSQSD
jgi:hypothetical protein